MAGERVSGLSGGDHHYRMVGGREIGDAAQAGAEALLIGVGIVADCARPTIERVVCARCRDRDVEPIAQYRDPTEEGVREQRDMRPPPLPLRHVGSIIWALLRQGGCKKIPQPHRTALLLGML